MSRDRKNISIDGEVNDAIDANVNYSDLVNEWTRQYFMEGNFYAVEKAMFETMLETIEQSREEMHEQVDEMHDEMAAQVQSKIDHIDTVGYDENHETGSGQQWEEAKEALRGTPRDKTNPAIKNWAQKLNMAPKEVVEKLRDETTYQDGKFSSTT